MKVPEHRKIDHIPLPVSLREALTGVSYDVPYVSHKKYGKGSEIDSREREKQFLTSTNHAFYIGKFIPKTAREKITNLLGWVKKSEKKDDKTPASNERIYSEEYIAAALAYAFDHIAQGEKVQFCIGRVLSEVINGTEDVAGALSLQEEKNLIYQIAKKRFGKTEKDLNVVSFEDDHEHMDLIQSIKKDKSFLDSKSKQQNNGGESKIDPKIIEITKDSSSSDIAKVLHSAAEKHPSVMAEFQGMIPEKLEGEEAKIGKKYLYGMVEIAIRLREIIKGRSIHGGADRQGKYDAFITELIRGKQGRKYGKIPELQGLFTSLEDVAFEVLHIDTKNNPYKIAATVSNARWRLALVGALGLGAVGGAYQVGKFVERQEAQQKEMSVDVNLNRELSDTHFYFDQKFEVPKDKNILQFKHIMKTMMGYLKSRYPLTDKVIVEIEPLFAQYLIKQKDHLPALLESNHLKIDLVDRFIQEQHFYLLSKGINCGRPYEHLISHWSEFQNSLRSPTSTVLTEGYKPEDGKCIPNAVWLPDCSKGKVQEIGSFFASKDYGLDNEYRLGIVTENDKRYVVAVDQEMGWKGGKKEDVYTMAKGKEAAEKFVDAMRKYDILHLKEYFHQLYEAADRKIDEKTKEQVRSLLGENEKLHVNQIAVYKDFFGQFSFELGLVTVDGNSIYGERRKILVAKKTGEEKFSLESAQEAGQHFGAASESHMRKSNQRFSY